MQFKRLRPLGITLLIGGGGAYAFHRYRKHANEGLGASSFKIPIRQRNEQGQIVTVTMQLPYLDNAILEKRVRLFSKNLWTDSKSKATNGNRLQINFTGAQLNSNQPVEDMDPEAIVYKYGDSERSPIIVAAVADGHSGPYTTFVLQHRLSALMIRNLLHHSNFKIPFSLLQDKDGVTRIPATFKLDSKNTGRIIKQAFEALDYWIVWESPKGLVHPESNNGKPANPDPDLPLGQILPAYSGACALATLVDTEQEELWVACTGDCRAVAGFWEEKEDGTGAWRVDVLSEDQTAESPKEIAR
jgi:pyruvate dehydrogenase phosphatase